VRRGEARARRCPVQRAGKQQQYRRRPSAARSSQGSLGGGPTARLFGRESWGPVVAAAVGVHVDGLKPEGDRGPFGFSTPRTPPVSTQEREVSTSTSTRVTCL
jgi:hypothetical protein